MLHGVKAQDYLAQLRECLTAIKTVNKTDVITMLSTFGSLKDISKASADDLNLLPGFGTNKAERVHALFHTPLRTRVSAPARPRRLCIQRGRGRAHRLCAWALGRLAATGLTGARVASKHAGI